mgnify:CR=1 FL=1
MVIYEDLDCVVISKPPGMVVNRAESVRAKTVQDWAERQAWFPSRTDDLIQHLTDTELVRQFFLRSGMVHRLDKDTSGALLLAKHPSAMQELQRQFHDRETQKTYLALVHGQIEVNGATIVLPLGRSPETRGRFVVDPHGRHSETRYEVLVRVPSHEKDSTGFSLVRLYPKTGRTHQLRVHMKHIGHPLVADQLYLPKPRWQKDQLWCSRHWLHAAELQFAQPSSGESRKVVAPIPDDLKHALSHLQLDISHLSHL